MKNRFMSLEKRLLECGEKEERIRFLLPKVVMDLNCKQLEIRAMQAVTLTPKNISEVSL